MTSLAGNREKKPKKPGAGKGSRGAREKSSKTGVVEEMIKTFEEKLRSSEAKVTVGDYIRLVQFRDELEAGEAKEIKVTWVEPIEEEPVTET